MSPTRFHRNLAGGIAALTLLLSPTTLAQSPEENFYKAYYLQHEKGQLEAAFELYRGVATDRSAGKGLRERAKAAVAVIVEDLATSDFARLMPADTIFYLELNRPGDQIGMLLDQLGLLGVAEGGRAFGVSPQLIEGALGVRGAAVAITRIDPSGGKPDGVLILHPGDQHTVRGLIETGLPASGRPVDSIHGFPTWRVEGEALVTLTSRLLIAGSTPELIEGVLARMQGEGLESLAETGSLDAAQSMRGEDLIFFHLNAKPVLPMLRMALEQEARRDPQAAMAIAFLDIDSLRGFSGRLGVGKRGLRLDFALELEQGHQNLLFNLMRTPAVGKETLKLVPEGAAFFLATSFNEDSCVAPPSGEPGRPIVTFMDFGREVFGNIVDVVVYGMPPDDEAARGMPIPGVVACIRVNDVERSRALWNFILGLASQSTGQPTMAPEMVEIAGVEVERYAIQGVPVYLVARENEMLVSASRSAIARTLKARKGGTSITGDKLFAKCLKGMGKNNTTALMLNPGRCAQMAQPFMSERELAKMQPVIEILRKTILSVGVQQTDTRLAMRTRVENLPDLGPLVTMLIEQRRDGPGSRMMAAAAPPAKKAKKKKAAKTRKSDRFEEIEGADTGELRGWFDKIAADPEQKKAASAIGEKLFEALGNDPVGLNDLAWELLTEDHYRGAFTKLARKVARKSNELADYSNWMLLDTLALAEFESGNFEKAIALEKKALELAQGTGREAEVEQALKRFIKGAEKKKAKGKKKRIVEAG